jgi:hypothetical protein
MVPSLHEPQCALLVPNPEEAARGRFNRSPIAACTGWRRLPSLPGRIDGNRRSIAKK